MMGMGAEAQSRLNAVLIDHPQRAEAHVSWIVIIGKRKRVIGIQPAMIEMSPLCRAPNGYHIVTVYIVVLSALCATYFLFAATHFFKSTSVRVFSTRSFSAQPRRAV